MNVSRFRFFVALLMTVLLPLSLVAQDAPSAVVHHSGGVWVNGTEAADSTALFKGDTLETRPGLIANLDIAGTSVLIQGETIIRFEGDHLILDHGSVSVGTGTEFYVQVNCIEVRPVVSDRTQYNVTDRSGKVDVQADKNDVRIRHGGKDSKPSEENSSSNSGVVHEGHEDTRYESTLCGGAARPLSPTNGTNTKWAEIGGGAGGAVVLCLLLCKGKGPASVSPSQP